MAKKKELSECIEELRKAASVICEVADRLGTQFAGSELKAAGSEENAEDAPKLTLEQVRAVLAEKSANGHGAEIRELFKKYGQTKLSEIAPKDYAALLADAEVIE